MRALVALVLATLSIAAPAAASTRTDSPSVSVVINTTEVHTRIGQHFSFTTTVRNNTDQAQPGLVAHLNVLSVQPSVYVDPEDWSSHRSVYLDTLPPHGSVDVPWRVQVVNDGQFVLYVAVTTRSGPATVEVSDGLRLTSAAQTSLAARGSLPVVLGVPIALAAVMLLNGARRRRLR